jgi:hypothetical protein
MKAGGDVNPPVADVGVVAACWVTVERPEPDSAEAYDVEPARGNDAGWRGPVGWVGLVGFFPVGG